MDRPSPLCQQAYRNHMVPSTPERREGLRACYWEGPMPCHHASSKVSEFSKRKYVNDHSCRASHIQVWQNEKHVIFTKRKQKTLLLRTRTRILTFQGLGYRFVLKNITLAVLKMTANSPPLEILNLIPKSPLGPPGLWLAVRMIQGKSPVPP